MESQHLTDSDARACPSVEQLKGFASGRLSEPELEEIAEHLESCVPCSAILSNLGDGNESLAGSLRRATETEQGSESVRTRSDDDATMPLRIADTDAPLPHHVGRYAVLRRLGQGGFGVVYLAQDDDLDRQVAVKVPYPLRLHDSGGLEQYHAEARRHAALDHSSIVPIYDVGHDANVPFFLVTKHIPGVNLAERLRCGTLDVRAVAELVATIADALEHTHDRGLLHLDVKPRNILLDADGHAYLTDFGLARRTGGASDGGMGIAGTPAYMSPEQARGAALDGRSDIFSLGVVLYELLTGSRPFRREHGPLLRQVARGEAPPPRAVEPRVPRDLEAICLKAMAPQRDQRYARAADLAADLRRYLRGEPPTGARPVGAVERLRAWTRRNRAATALVAALLVLTPLAIVPALRLGGTHGPTAGSFLTPVQAVINTEPAGADIFFVPLDAATGVPMPADGTHGKAGEALGLQPGNYLIVATLNGGERFHEVYRHVPGTRGAIGDAYPFNRWKLIDGVVHLRDVKIPEAKITTGMALVPATADFQVGSLDLAGHAPPHHRSISAFYIDPTEITVGEYRKSVVSYRDPDGRRPPDDYPVHNVTWQAATSFAEYVGKRLPDEFEYEYAATACGQRDRPWATDVVPAADWPLGAVGTPAYDVLLLPGQPPIHGLYSNVGEWTASWWSPYPGQQSPPQLRTEMRVVRGAPLAVLKGAKPAANDVARGPRHRIAVSFVDRQPGLGFRCVRSARPRLRPEDFGMHVRSNEPRP